MLDIEHKTTVKQSREYGTWNLKGYRSQNLETHGLRLRDLFTESFIWGSLVSLIAWLRATLQEGSGNRTEALAHPAAALVCIPDSVILSVPVSCCLSVSPHSRHPICPLSLSLSLCLSHTLSRSLALFLSLSFPISRSLSSPLPPV